MTGTGAPQIPLIGGFESSSHRRSDGVRVDVVSDTAHAELALPDYRLMHTAGITTVRESLRWHIIEKDRGRRNWSSAEALLEAARLTSTEIIWDLLHFGFPDWVNPYHPDFPSIFADFAADFVSRNPSGGIYVPVNEISFLSWAAGDVEYMFPYSKERGPDLKYALCAASLAAIRAIRMIDPRALIVTVDPVIAVHPDKMADDPQSCFAYHETQFEAVDMLLGRQCQELGGHADMIDVIGLNHYPQSQWTIGKGSVDWKSEDWVKPSVLLQQVFARYGKPILIAETGCEGDDRPEWFWHIANECAIAASAGVPIMGLCLYPILSHQAWTGERHCPNGLFDGTVQSRDAFIPLLKAVGQYQGIDFGRVFAGAATVEKMAYQCSGGA